MTKKLYSYIVASDTGFAPNPYGKYCTLATCKPKIRETARISDWIVGLSPKARGHKLIYAMQIAEILTYANYYQDPRFADKIPRCSKNVPNCQCGDNIYELLPTGAYRQLQSRHSGPTGENIEHKKHDLKGKNVLIAHRFYYYGSQALNLPDEFRVLIVGRGHKCSFPESFVSQFEQFILAQPVGCHASPSLENKSCPHRP